MGKKRYESFSEELMKYIEKRYTEEYSVSIVLEEVKNKFDSTIGRNSITEYLKSINLYEGLSGQNYTKKNKERMVDTMKERYGVVNWGQLKNSGVSITNDIPYNKLNFSHKFEKFKKDVEKLSKKNVAKIEKPLLCEYTNIPFADNIKQPNPNDPLKRTIDHKVPVLHAFIKGWSVDKTASLDNISFTLRIINSIKGNTLYDSFLQILPDIQRMIDEN